MRRLVVFGLMLPLLLAGWGTAARAEGLGVVSADGSAAPPEHVTGAAEALGLDPTTFRPLATPGRSAGWHAVGVSVLGCAGQLPPDLAAATADAQGRLEALESGLALSVLSGAVEALPCASSFVEPTELAAALDLMGQAAQDEARTDAAEMAYRQLLAIAPGHKLASPPGTGYEVLWQEVRRGVLEAGTTTVAIQHAEAGAEAVRLNGRVIPPAWAGTEQVPPGRHLLQWTDGVTLKGAWVRVEAGVAEAALVSVGAVSPLLTAGASDAGHKLALSVWLQLVAFGAGLDGVVVVQQAQPLSGYAVRGAGVEAWAATVEATASHEVSVDRLRLAVGGGWLLAVGYSYGDIRAGLGIRVVGPLFIRLEGDLGISQPLEIPNGEFDEVVAFLPGFGAGVALRLPKGSIQPFAAISLGVWITPSEYIDPVADDAETAGSNSESVEELRARRPVTFRGFVDGGLDLIPPGAGPLVLRVSGGVGYGYGFQARFGAHVGVRLGGPKNAK